MNTEIQKAFHEAVSHNDIVTVRRMIAAGADVNAPYDEYENRSFLDACYSGNLAMVKMLVEAGADVNLPDACGVVPLVRAIVSLKDADEVIKYLIASGADVKGKDGSMSLPLHVAVSENDIKIAAQLLAAGANPNIEDDEGKNALFGAVENGNERMLLLLLNHGADVNHEDEDGYTPLSLASIKGNVELCKLLIELGAKSEGVYSVLGNSILMDAILGGNPDCVKLILKQGVDVNVENDECDTALSMAIFYNMGLDIVEQILNAGADPNVELANGSTPLALAVQEEDCDAMQLLLRRDAVFNNDSEYYADFVLIHANEHLLYKSLMRKGYSLRSDDDAVILYVKHACSYLLRKALEEGANPNAADVTGKHALEWALAHPRHPQGCAARLIRNGATFEPTLLIRAIQLRQRELVIALLERELDVNVTDERGCSALHYAARMGKTYFITSLLSKGADIELKNKSGYSPLLLALRYRNKAAATLLIKHGADPLATGGKHNEDAYATCMRYRICLYDFIHIFSSIPNCERMKECLFNYLQNSICAEEKDVQNEAIQELLKRAISTKDVT